MAEAISRDSVVDTESSGDSGASGDAVKDFFADSDGLTDEHGNDIDAEKQEDDEDTTDETGKTGIEKPKAKEAKADDGKGGDKGGEFKKPDGIAGSFFSDSGELDHEALAKFAGIKEPLKYERKAPPQGAKKPDNAEPPKEFGEERIERYHTQRQAIIDNYNAALQAMYDVLPADSNRDAALNAAVQAINKKLEPHFLDMQKQMQLEIRQHDQKANRDQSEMIELKPQAESNRAIIAQRLGGFEKFNQLFGDQSAGGGLLLMLFDMVDPDHANMQGQEFTKAFNSWFTRTSANMQHLERITQLAQLSVLSNPAVFDKLVGRIRSAKDGQDLNRGKSRKPKPSGVNRNQPSSEPDAFDKYMNGAGGEILDL